jgi:glycosyltransferase involved in cell wall biosynthesis
MGWTVRSLAYLLDCIGIGFSGYDISKLFFSEEMAESLPPPAPRGGGPVTLIVALMPNRYRYALASLPRNLVRGAYIIGYSVYELETLPADYVRGLKDVDEIWTPSSFSAGAFAKAAPGKPVRVVPHIIRAPSGVVADRKKFGLPPDAFIVMAFGSVKSGATRKNLFGAADAFQKAFPEDTDVCLVLKISDQDWAPGRLSALRARIAEDPRIIVYSETTTDEDLWKLMACGNTIISLHRAEGFGLVLAQAMLLGKPLITPLWSGPQDFLTPDTALLVDFKLVPVSDPEGNFTQVGARWMEPNIADAAAALKHIRKDPANAQAVAERGRRALEHFMIPLTWARTVNEALCREPELVPTSHQSEAKDAPPR